MKILRVLICVGVFILLAACSISLGDQTVGSGKVITAEREVENFTAIDLSCSADVTIELGEMLAVSIEGEDNILPLIETRVSGGTLNIDAKANTSFRTTKPLVVHITIPELDSIRSTGSGDVAVGAWTAGRVELETTGSGDIDIDSLEAASITARLSGSGDIRIARGRTERQNVRTSGSGDYDAARVNSSRAEAATSGSGNITLWVTDELTADTSGSGDILYYGSPSVDRSETGSGSVENEGDEP